MCHLLFVNLNECLLETERLSFAVFITNDLRQRFKSFDSMSLLDISLSNIPGSLPSCFAVSTNMRLNATFASNRLCKSVLALVKQQKGEWVAKSFAVSVNNFDEEKISFTLDNLNGETIHRNAFDIYKPNYAVLQFY